MASGSSPALVLQLTPNTAQMQKELTALMARVQGIDRDWQSREHKLKQKEEEMGKEYAAKEQNLDFERQRMEEDFKAQEARLEWVKEDLALKEKKLDESRITSNEIAGRQNPITIEVGGDKFRTQVQTLVQHRESIFPELLRALQAHSPQKGKNNPNPTIFIDRDGKHFKFILNFMRQGEEVMWGSALRNTDDFILNEILCEVRYYKLADLERLLERRRVAIKKPLEIGDLVKSHFFTTQIQPLKAQTFKYKTAKEVIFKNENLTNIVFDRVLFDQNVSFEGCVMARATFRECVFRAAVSFKNVDLFEAKFENCLGIEFSKRIYLKNTNMKNVHFSPKLKQEEEG